MMRAFLAVSFRVSEQVPAPSKSFSCSKRDGSGRETVVRRRRQAAEVGERLFTSPAPPGVLGCSRSHVATSAHKPSAVKRRKQG